MIYILSGRGGQPLRFVGVEGTMELSIDIETYSSVNLKECGVYKYAESEDFEILLFGYSIDGGPVTVIDLACGEKIPEEILDAITDINVLKWAHNASFERICLSTYINRIKGATGYLSPESWRCTMIWCAYRGLPLSLEMVGGVLKLSEQKLDEGKALIKYFSVPCASTKANGGRTRNLPEHAPDKWEMYKFYNKRDVEVELQIKEKLKNYPVPDFIWDEWTLIDQPINDRGVLLDMAVVDNAISINEKVSQMLMDRLRSLTGLDNPNSPLQIRAWLRERDIETDSIDKKAVTELLKVASTEVSEVLTLRQQIAKSSVKKYVAMKNLRCKDGRAHGCFQFMGASRTGRWAGRYIQYQNLPQNHMSDLAEARDLVRCGNLDALSILYDNIPLVLSELIRTASIPPRGMKYIVSDFSAIEARALSYLAGEKWRIKSFLNNEDIYCASASAMFGIPVEKHGINADKRSVGKLCELSLGYGGSVGAMVAFGALDMGFTEDELSGLVHMWRESNPAIVRYWWDVDRAVKTAVSERTETRVGSISFKYKGGMLLIKLPSGRELTYVKPHIGINKFGSESVMYYGLDATKHWSKVESYGPKFVENITQAVSRDILVYAMKTLSDCRIVAHVHDEVVIEAPMDMKVEDVCKKMSQTPPWIEGLPLRADGYECEFYMKE